MFAQIARERDVISYTDGCDTAGRAYMLKCRLRDGRDDVVLLAPAVAFHVRDSFKKAIRDPRLNYRDQRRRKDDPRPETAAIREFLDRQPDIQPSDWDPTTVDALRFAVGCEVHAFRDAICLALLVDPKKSIYKALRFPRQIVFYLPEMIDKVERLGDLINIEAMKPPSGSKH